MNKFRLAATAAFMLVGSSAAFASACLEAYTAQAEPVLSKKCVACHNDAAPGAGLSLQKGSGYDFLVNVASSELPSMPRVTPGNLELSYLAHKLQDTHESVGGSGTKMPPSGSLRPAELQKVLDWIAACPVEEAAAAAPAADAAVK
jgi:cytochrome c553